MTGVSYLQWILLHPNARFLTRRPRNAQPSPSSMRALRIRFLHGALLGAFLTQACATAGGTSTDISPTATNQAPDPSMAELEAIYRARADSALAQVSDADVDFMTGMIGHHAQALVMSALAPTNGASPTMRTLTARIINAQKDEIAVMQAWLGDRNKRVPEVHEDGTTEMSHNPEMHMPGMLTPAQLQELTAAQGPEFDRLFLVFMIQHHKGAVTMVHELFATDGAAQDDLVFKLASDIQVDQASEIARMQRMLDALPEPG